MSSEELKLPLIDFGGYFDPKSPNDQQKVINEVRDACRKYGFFQVKNHGIPLQSQQELLKSLDRFFNLSNDEKKELSFLKSLCRRGYEGSGTVVRDGESLADAKEAFYIGREDDVPGFSGFYGPNVWPNLPEDVFRKPVLAYYQMTSGLAKTIWEILLQGMGYSPSLMESFGKRPMVQMKMLRYPAPVNTRPGQFGVGAHNDFGGVTVLLQQPGKDGLEVWLEEQQTWMDVPALEDIFIINCGDMIMNWSGHFYKSVRHRVVNKAQSERFSCATFWHGDILATNPLNPNDPDKTTVGQLLVRRFRNQMSIDKEAMMQVGEV